jgi:oligopeptide/dipeptide ABC transporter ATP-binding protein
MTALSVPELTVTAGSPGGRVPLVAGAEFALGDGEVLGIVGETGAGKTMTMRALLGLLPKGVRAAGTAVIEGEEFDLADARKLRALLGRKTGLVLQNPAGMLDPLARIGRQLEEGVVQHRIMRRVDARRRAEHLLETMGLDATAVLELYPHQISGGMAQRVAIAMALMPRPLVLFVDEPTSALDAHLRVEVLTLLRNVARDEGCSIVLVSHDLGLVGHFCDTVVVMYAGHVIERGPVAAVLHRPTHPYTADLLACSTSLDAERRAPLRSIAGSPPAPGSWPEGCVFAPRCTVAVEQSALERPQLRRFGARAVACHRAADEIAREEL